MIILHIASIFDTAISGTDVAVPLHLNAQSEFAEIGFVNVTGIDIPSIKNQFPYDKSFRLADLPAPFNKPDLIVFHEVYKPAYLRLYKQAKAAGVPYIVFPQGCLTRSAQKKKRLKKVVANTLLFNRFINGAEALQFLSEWERDNSPFGVNKFVGSHGMTVPDKCFRGGCKSSVQIVYIGRTEVYIKGLDLMLQAVASSAGLLHSMNASLTLYGPDWGSRHAEIMSLIQRYNIGDIVELKDSITGEDKASVLKSADLFIQTSRTDAFPLGVLEALSYGIPCLVTEGTSFGKIIAENNAGWSCDTNAEAISEMIIQALNERDCWASKGENAVSLIENNYAWSVVVGRTVDDYRKYLR